MREKSKLGIRVTKEDRLKHSTTSKGNQIKWRTVHGAWLKADSLGYEGLAESASSHILSKSNISEYVDYSMTYIDEDGKLYRGCCCKDFLGEGDSLITLARLMKLVQPRLLERNVNISTENYIESAITLVEEFTGIRSFGEWLGKLLEFDAFILNEDRHLNNIAIIKNDVKDEYRLMPVFDNGLSLLSDLNDYPMSVGSSINIRKVKSKPFASKFDRQIKAVKNVLGLKLKLSKTLLDFDNSKVTIYERRYVDRVESVIKAQANKYNYLF